MLSISKEANTNYLAKLVVLKDLRKHPNADKLQVVNIDFQQVITGMEAKDGDVYVYFPLECVINHEFLSATNSFRHSHLNKVVDDENCGFFEDSGRVRAVRLRGEPSMGYIVPAKTVADFTGYLFKETDIGQEFDTIKDILMLKKYVVPIRGGVNEKRQGKVVKRISRLVDKQVRLHVDTEQLRKNMHKFDLKDMMSITYKLHGTSFWVSNVLGKRKLNIIEKIAKKIGIGVRDTEYDYFYGSRKVVKNEFETAKSAHFYEYDLWGEIKEEIKDRIPKGYTIYGELVGYTKSGALIQREYDYGCEVGKNKIYIYRITFTNQDGIVNELSTHQMIEYCKHYNLNYVPLLYLGTLEDFLYRNTEDRAERWHQEFLKKLEDQYTEKDCYICVNKVPEEGAVIKRETMFSFEAFKLKSFAFLLKESEELDKGQSNIEDDTSI